LRLENKKHAIIPLRQAKRIVLPQTFRVGCFIPALPLTLLASSEALLADTSLRPMRIRVHMRTNLTCEDGNSRTTHHFRLPEVFPGNRSCEVGISETSPKGIKK
jgi:hypothetical protein